MRQRKKWLSVGVYRTDWRTQQQQRLPHHLSNTFRTLLTPFPSYPSLSAPPIAPPTLSFLYCSSFLSLLPFSTTSPLSTSLLFSPFSFFFLLSFFSFFSFVGKIGFVRISVIIIYIWDRI